MDRQLVLAEFDRQSSLISRNEIRSHFRIDDQALKSTLAHLRVQASQHSENIDAVIPFCIVINETPFPTTQLMGQVEAKGAKGVVDMNPVEPGSFELIDNIQLPSGQAYLLLNIDTGKRFLNVSPEESLSLILKAGRTPLTLEEGVMTALFFQS